MSLKRILVEILFSLPIRLRLWRVFGGQITIILDWNHLDKKIWTLMSMIACNKTQKEQAAKALVAMLWEGRTDEAITYLQSMPVKNQLKQTELVEYDAFGFIKRNA